jgi:trimeric autotransporter adhesin
MRKIYVLLLAITLFAARGYAQSLANYAFSSSTTASLTDMSSGTTNFTNLAPGAAYDDVASALTGIPFPFYFMGTPYSQFSVNTNGQLRFGTTVIAGTNVSVPAAGAAVLAPLSGDNSIAATGRVHYKVTGSPGSQVMTVAWDSLVVPFSSTPGILSGTVQARFYEGTGRIEFVYGRVFNNSASATTRSIFLGSGNTATTNGSVTVGAVPAFTLSATNTNNSFAASAYVANVSNNTDGSRIMYTWLPGQTPPADPVSLSFTGVGLTTTTINWVDNSTDELSFTVLRSADGGATYTVAGVVTSTTVAGTGTAYNFVATGLTPSTNYTWRVVAHTEGVTSTPGLTGNQATGACSISGTIPVGPTGTYTSLTAALAALNTNGLSGPVILELQAAYVSSVETFPITIGNIPCASAVNNLTIRPETGAAGLSISSANATATIDINGGNFVVIDGRPGGAGTVKQLTITNTSTSGNAIRFINEASNNIIRYTTITGVNTSTTNGVIFFGSTTGTNGNDNNTIDNNDIRDGATTPLHCITAVGTTTSTATNNSGNTISNNNIFNYFAAASDHYGVNLANGNTDWTITGNSFYQTVSRVITTSNTTSGIRISNTTSGNNFNITGNFIGGTAPSCGGTAQTYTGSSATVGIIFRGLQLSVAATVVTSVQGNTIQNLNLSTGANSTATSCISLISGRFNVGNITGNTIGSQSVANSIVYTNTSTTTGNIITAILAGTGSADVMLIQNNTIGGIAVSTTSTATVSLRGIGFQGTTGTFTVTGNTIGSNAIANSLSNATNSSILGIFGAASLTSVTQNITGNTIANLGVTTTGTSGQVIGILAQGNSGGIYNTTGNTIRNLTNTAANTGTNGSASVIGISHIAATTGGQAISQNTVHSLSNSSVAASNISVTGIFYSGPTSGTNVVSRNFVHSLTQSSTGGAPFIFGINVQGSGTTSFANNMIRLGIDAAGADITGNYAINGINDGIGTNNYFHNSVYIGGSANGTLNCFAFSSLVTTNTRVFQDNIFVNQRSNAGTGRSYAVSVAGTAPNPGGLTINYNDYFVSGTGTVLGRFNSLNVADLAAWQAAVGQDVNSLAGDPRYINPTGTAATVDLHINTSLPTPVEGVGLAIASVTDDFDGQVRAGLTPVDIGADAGNFIAADITAPIITFTPILDTCFTGNRTVVAAITDASGVPTSGAGLPVLYWRINSGAYTAATGSFMSGNNYQFTFGGGAAIGDTVFYYIAAQDNAVPANITTAPAIGAGGFSANPPAASTPPTTPARYLVRPTFSGTFTVGTGGNYPTLTAAVNAYNNSCLSGPVVFSLIDATYPAETFPITINANPDASSVNTLTIKPATGVTPLISGSSPTGIIRLNGADWVTIDGSNSNTVNNPCPPVTAASRDLTIINTSNVTATAAIWISGLGAGAGAANNTIKNSNLSAGADQSTGTLETFGILINGNAIATTADGVDNNNNTIENNSITRVRFGIYVRGGATASNTNTIIRQNLVGPAAFGADQVGKAGIVIQHQLNPVISYNEVRFVGVQIAQAASGGDRVGIGVGGFDGPSTPTTNISGASVIKNNIHDIVDEKTFSAIGITIAGTGTPSANTIANNFISNIRANGTSGDQTIGINIVAGTGDRVVFNSISLTGDLDPGASSSASVSAAGIRINSTTPANLTLKNNLVSVNISSNTASLKHYAIVAPATSYAWGTGGADNNDYYVNPANTQMVLGGIGTTSPFTDVTTLASWKTQFTPNQDAASINVAPIFTSATDLHLLPTNFDIDGKGTPITGITDDIDCEVRNVSTPDIGADEFVPPACTAAVGGTASGSATFCATGGGTITATGYSVGASSTYNWVQSTNGGATWTAITGANNPASYTISPAVTTTTLYKLAVGCAANSSFDSSTVVTITINPLPTISISPAGPVNICAPATQLLTATSSAATPGYQWRLNGGNIPGEINATYTATASGSYSVTVTDGVTTCSNTSAAVVVNIETAPTAPLVTPATATICAGQDLALSAASTTTIVSTIFSENFNSTTAGTTTSGNLPAGWTGASLTSGVRIWGVVASAQAGSNIGTSNFLYCESDGYTAFQTRSRVITPTFDASAYNSINIKFKQFYNDVSSGALTDSCRVFISNDGGATWTLIQSYDTDQGTAFTPAGAINSSITVPGAVTLTNNMRVQLLYNSDASGNDWFWAIDDFVVEGSPKLNFSWTASPALGAGLPAGAGTPSITNNNIVITPSAAGAIVYTVTAANPVSGCSTTGTATITVTASGNPGGLAGTIGGVQICQSVAVASAGTQYFDGSCNLIARVLPNGASPVAGTVNSCVTIDATVQSYNAEPYLQRHFDIEPATAPSTSTARITLYALQSEFDTYNANNGGFPDIPANPTDNVGKANLRVTQYHGTGTAPGNYTGQAELINPADADIVWNSAFNRWEISFNVTSFSGFYIHSTVSGFPLPVKVSFAGEKAGSANFLRWTTTSETNNKGFELQRAADGQNFTSLGFIPSQAVNGNSSIDLHYNFTDNNPAVKSYYRLKIISRDDKISYSNIILLRGEKPVKLTIGNLYPNPTADVLNIVLDAPVRDKVTLVITDLAGKIMKQEVVQVEAGTNTVDTRVNGLPAGTYIIKAICANNCESTVGRFVKK